MNIRYFSRHEATPEIIESINNTLDGMGIYSHHHEWESDGLTRGHSWTDINVQQDSTPFYSGVEVIERALDVLDNYVQDGIEKGIEPLNIAGVFPAEIIGRLVEAVQNQNVPVKKLNVITFKYKRDRETNTVSNLTHTIVWEISSDKLNISEHEVGGHA